MADWGRMAGLLPWIRHCAAPHVGVAVGVAYQNYWGPILSTSCEFYYDDVIVVTSLILSQSVQ